MQVWACFPKDFQKGNMNEGLNPKDFGINIDEIQKQIDILGSKGDDKRPKEQFNADTVEKYQSFARERLGFEFNDVSLFIAALTHKSYVNEHRNIKVEFNERLEYLGDAILELVTTDFLFRNFDEHEGIMTAWRSALVRTESIYAASEEIGYVDLIRVSKGEKKSGEGQASRAHISIVADCFEAVTGAIYMDQGYEAAKKHVYKYILSKMQKMVEAEDWRDAKSYLQELTQKAEGVIPVYQVVKEEGPDHDRFFEVVVRVGNTVRGKGSGHSKQDAQIAAAKEGIKYYKQIVIDTGRLSPSSL
ncbi:ribonuclease III [Candidatus Saccharibacteria bacterium]|nr:ribonuclease III [Candidatus Saccharibacteria bacterium]